jgi:alpha-tubulin suppressor-like RCC1 family protein
MAALPALDLGLNATAVSIAVGFNHSCAVLDDGSMRCWGNGGFGELGVGDDTDRPYPVEVPLGDGVAVTQVVAGDSYTCALFDDSTVKCWGYNVNGVLGTGDTEPRGRDGQTVADLAPLDLGGTPVALAAGGYHACALMQGGALKCWGSNSGGQLGLGDIAHRGDEPGEMGANLPVVDVGGAVAAVSAAESHTCALLDDGSTKCWGATFPWGQLGLGDLNARGDEPNEMGDQLPALNLEPTRQVATGRNHTCALSATDTIKCWGSNERGQLGIGEDTLYRDFLSSDYPTVDLE